MPKIEHLSGREVLDSRGRPTVLATCKLEGGISASASVPSGASTGQPKRSNCGMEIQSGYRGLGCRRAVTNIGGALHGALSWRAFADQAELDRAMIALDGTPTKSRIGANAILAVSVAFARACAMERGVPLYQHFADMLGASANVLPRLTINLFSGGKHAGQQVSVQDVLIIPMSAKSIDEILVSAFDVYQAAADLILRKYGMRLLTRGRRRISSALQVCRRNARVGGGKRSSRQATSRERMFFSASMLPRHISTTTISTIKMERF